MWLTWSVLVLGIIGTLASLTWMIMRRASTCRPPVLGPIVLAAASTVAVSVSWPSLL